MAIYDRPRQISQGFGTCPLQQLVKGSNLLVLRRFKLRGKYWSRQNTQGLVVTSEGPTHTTGKRLTNFMKQDAKHCTLEGIAPSSDTGWSLDA